ncbi:MAG: transposase [Candidatus Binatia bacterium]
MPNWRRAHVPGGSYFFTVVTDRRAPLFGEPSARRLLGSLIRRWQLRWPFTIEALVLLPDHLHAIWSLPPGEDEYSKRWGWIEKEFTKWWLRSGGREQPQTAGRRRDRRRGVWLPKFWEHTLESEDDFERHFDYAHYNPLKHGYARCPRDWPCTSFHRWVRRGVYPEDWACWQDGRTLDFRDLDKTVGE